MNEKALEQLDKAKELLNSAILWLSKGDSETAWSESNKAQSLIEEAMEGMREEEEEE